MSASNLSIRNALYEKPGPKTKRTISIVTAISLFILAYVLYLIVRQFAVTGQLQAKYWNFFLKPTTWRFLGQGLIGTIKAALCGGVMAFLLGFIMMLMRTYAIRPIKFLGIALIEFTRGVPTLLFIYFFFLVVPQTGIKLDPLWKISIPVAISASGVVAEVLRSGINAVPKGQTEAAISLGMRGASVFTKVVFPQAVRYIIPALIAELVIVLKDTTFAYVVSFPDLMQNAKVLISNYDALVSTYFVVAVIYILINYVLNKVSVAVAKRLNVQTVDVAKV